MEYLRKIILAFFISAGSFQSCIACGGIIKYREHRWLIQSPNFGAEYGKAANCSWEFQNINTRYALQLKLTSLRMFHYDVNGDKQCGDSYRLIINREQVNCMLDIVSGSDTQYYQFYSSPSCGDMECGLYCDRKIKIDSSTITIEYIADGSKPTSAGPDEIWGFFMHYQYVECPSAIENSRTQIATTSSDSTSIPPTSLRTTSEVSLRSSTPRLATTTTPARRITAATRAPTTTVNLPCGGNLDQGSGHIQSPNFGTEYGSAGNCSWRFRHINKNYALKLMVTDMRMYYYDVNGDKQCGDSYRLVINGNRVDCTKKIIPKSTLPLYFSYKKPSCPRIKCDHGCDDWTEINTWAVKVEYVADGSRPNPNLRAGEMWGFRIKYQYFRCQSGDGKQDVRTSSPRNPSPISPISRVTSILRTGPPLDSNTIYDATTVKMRAVDSKWGVDAASLMIGVGSTVVAMVMVLLVWRFARKKRRENVNVDTHSGDVIPARQDWKKVEYVNVTATTSQSVYSEVTMATQRQSSRAAPSESLKQAMDNNDDIILVEMPGYQAVELGPEQDEGGYVAPIVHD